MRLYIGTSLGRCLRSMLLGEVSYDQVLLISTGTWAETKESYLDVVRGYHSGVGASDYDMATWSLEEVSALALKLWCNGKIHQPRNFGGRPLFPSYSDIWIEIFPPQVLENPAAKDLWNQLSIIARLYE